MKIAGFMSGLVVALMVPAQGVSAQDKPGFAVVNEDVGVPVFPNDITDRPYTVIGEVKAGVRKATVFSKEASQEKIYKELWERASKLGADAVVNAKYGDSHISAFSWGKTNATGTAIKFTTPAAQSAPNPPVAAVPSEADKN